MHEGRLLLLSWTGAFLVRLHQLAGQVYGAAMSGNYASGELIQALLPP